MTLRLTYTPPLAVERLLAFFAARAVPGLERVADGTYARSLRTRAGPVVVEMTPEPERSGVTTRVFPMGDGGKDLVTIERRVRRLFDLDVDAASIDAALAEDPVLRPLVARAPGTRVPGAASGLEMVVRAIVGQQVSVAGARTTLGRIVTRFGEPLEVPHGSITHAFPRPERLAAADRGAFGMPASRADAIRSVARMIADGELDLDGGSDLRSTLETLVSVRGVGPWTAGYVAMRALADPDAFPATDLGVRRAFAALRLPDDPRSIRDRTERWRPWRAYATMQMWQVQAPACAGERAVMHFADA